MNKDKKQLVLNWLQDFEQNNALDDTRAQVFGIIRELINTKKYGLVFEEKQEDIINQVNNSIVTLERKDQIITNKNNKLNFLLEGDNYAALKLLQKTHRNRIDVIYIDPPYNTGVKDFIYNDNYVDKEDAFKHSKWLSFMKPRLEIARDLLHNNGVIFISIDDREQAALKLLCDEIFGEGNFIGLLPRLTTTGGKTHDNTLAKQHDYVLIYIKQHNSNTRELLFNHEPLDSKSFNKDDNDGRGKYRLVRLLAEKNLDERTGSQAEPIEFNGKIFYPVLPNGKKWYWRWGTERVELGKKLGLIVEEKGVLKTKLYFEYDFKQGATELTKKDRVKLFASTDLVSYEFSNDNGTKELQKIMGETKTFNFPKTINLIYKLIKLIKNKDAIVLDFFAGSGTTGHAVAKLNAEDGGDRNYILCTNNENNIAENVTFKRLSNIQEELPHNLIYNKINLISNEEFINSNFDEKYLKQIYVSCKELIQLETAKLIDNNEILVITSQEELNSYSDTELLDAKIIFYVTDAVAIHKHTLFNEISNKLVQIPEKYYFSELSEVDYLW
ncbi:site-specific DNA-methyltransferase [Mycoplasma seminis]|uniref:Site-specific DNA-methyltransferase n=1 Tax=Mycoplasma seminis TaxID=512749 RepID=A0ABY9HBI7_9MOLU|nr:site-specific DNA-methyltransferase [Mycoplasma seminis]WLP85902.1 site-specific DNA-methyltransferase [Mycoplasma seminis]